MGVISQKRVNKTKENPEEKSWQMFSTILLNIVPAIITMTAISIYIYTSIQANTSHDNDGDEDSSNLKCIDIDIDANITKSK